MCAWLSFLRPLNTHYCSCFHFSILKERSRFFGSSFSTWVLLNSLSPNTTIPQSTSNPLKQNTFVPLQNTMKRRQHFNVRPCYFSLIWTRSWFIISNPNVSKLTSFIPFFREPCLFSSLQTFPLLRNPLKSRLNSRKLIFRISFFQFSSSVSPKKLFATNFSGPSDVLIIFEERKKKIKTKK